MGLTTGRRSATPMRGISALPLASGNAGGVAVLASPTVRALATAWIASWRAYFRTVDRAVASSPDSQHRREVDDATAVRHDEVVRQQIIAMRSTEPGALALKVAVFLAHLRGPEAADAVISEMVACEGPFEEAIALSLARDMADVFGPSVQALADVARPGRRS